MTKERIDQFLAQGEGLQVEFKESLYTLNKSTFETICAFLNRQGGHLLLGVANDGTVEGVLENEAEKMVNEIVNNAHNPQKLHPVVYLSPEVIDYEGKKIIYVWVPESSQVHQTAGKIFDRNARDGDINITPHHHQVTQLYLRKQHTYTENRILPAVQGSDLRADLLQRVRVLAGNQRPHHPWSGMTDEELMRSAGLHLKDVQTGQEGYTLAGVLLVGKDEVIQSALPHHKTDALVRIVNKDRYDDRDDIRTNLIESYDRLMAFVAKHLPDVFYLEGVQRINLRDRIFREVVANLLVHREYSNAFPAKLIIEEDRVVTENWNRPHGHGPIDPALFTPFPKNPVIARFFKEIGWVDELGSGVRNTFKYTAIYSNGKDPVFEEGDVFRTIIPIGRIGSLTGQTGGKSAVSGQVSDQVSDQVADQVDKGRELVHELRRPAAFEKWLQILEGLLLNQPPSFTTKQLDRYKPILEGFSEEWKKVLEYCVTPKSRKQILEEGLGMSNHTTNFKNHVEPLLVQKLINRTIPDKPQSQHQKYFTTEKGKILLHLLQEADKNNK